MLQTIFIDVDDVIKPWAACALRLVYPQITVEEIGDITAAGIRGDAFRSHFGGAQGLHDIVDAAGYSFWADMPSFDYAHELIKLCYTCVPSVRLAFLTSPSSWPISAAAKLACLPKEFPGIPVIVTHAKHFCARPDAFLIDDHLENCEMFTAVGGYAYNWSSNYKLDPCAMFLQIPNRLRRWIKETA